MENDSKRPMEAETSVEGNEKIRVSLRYFVRKAQGGFSDYKTMDCVIRDEDLSKLCHKARERGFFEEESENVITGFPDTELEDIYLGLYQQVIAQVEAWATERGYEKQEGSLGFIMLLPWELIKAHL